MKFGYIWQQETITGFPNIDVQALLDLAKEFSDVFDAKIEVNWAQSEKGMIAINYTGQKLCFLFFKLHVHLYNSDYNDCNSGTISECPRVEIVDILLSPKGQGIGTRIMTRFIEEISKNPFKLIVLTAQSKEAARFWSKLGFKKVTGTDEWKPEMYLKLNPL